MYIRAICETKPFDDILIAVDVSLPGALDSPDACVLERCSPAYWFPLKVDRPVNELPPPAAKDARSSSKLRRLSRRLKSSLSSRPFSVSLDGTPTFVEESCPDESALAAATEHGDV